MATIHRRSILKGIALTLPAAWTTPLVKSVVLPAHAQTSQCSAPAGCYNAISGSFTWPGGTGLQVATGHPDPGCSGSPAGPIEIAVASSLDEAIALLSCSGSSSVVESISTDPPLPDGCNFYTCVTTTISAV